MPSASATQTRARRESKKAAAAASGPVRVAARAGYAARGVFYLLLAGLTVQVAADRGGGRQANAHGALSVIAGNVFGEAAIAGAALGFALLGLVRIAGAARDRSAARWRRLTTALQGIFYVALAGAPASFLLGRRQTGSEQQQHAETARLLRLPAGRELGVAVGVVVIAICVLQIRSALTEDFADGLRLRGARRWVKQVVAVAGIAGITARALIFLPIGVFLIIASVQADPRHADGLDAELAALARHPWGVAVLAVVALGLVVVAVYSLLEARYREVSRAN